MFSSKNSFVNSIIRSIDISTFLDHFISLPLFPCPPLDSDKFIHTVPQSVNCFYFIHTGVYAKSAGGVHSVTSPFSRQVLIYPFREPIKEHSYDLYPFGPYQQERRNAFRIYSSTKYPRYNTGISRISSIITFLYPVSVPTPNNKFPPRWTRRFKPMILL